MKTFNQSFRSDDGNFRTYSTRKELMELHGEMNVVNVI